MPGAFLLEVGKHWEKGALFGLCSGGYVLTVLKCPAGDHGEPWGGEGECPSRGEVRADARHQKRLLQVRGQIGEEVVKV